MGDCVAFVLGQILVLCWKGIPVLHSMLFSIPQSLTFLTKLPNVQQEKCTHVVL